MSFAYITEKGATVSQRDGCFVVSRNKEILFEIPKETLENLVVMSGVQITSRAICELLHHDIPLTLIAGNGRFLGRMESAGHIRIFKQKKQFSLQDQSFSLEMSRRILLAKVHNQLTLLRRYNYQRKISSVTIDIHNMMTMFDHAKQANTKEELRGYEGMAAKIYFSALGKIIDPVFYFEKRSKRPPLDPFNAMISLAYTLIAYEIFTAVVLEGLHPYVGCLHELKEGHPALVSDLLEEWRPVLADSLVMSLIQHHEIKEEYFYHEEETDGIYLTPEGRKIFLGAYEKKMRAVNQYLEGKHSYRRTLAYQVAQYSQALLAENPAIYEPIWIR